MTTWTAPYPEELAELLSSIRYKPGWNFDLETLNENGFEGLYLVISGQAQDAYRDDEYMVDFNFPMIVPPQIRTREGWLHWLFECILAAERHEAGEFFVIDGERPYAPTHHPYSEGFRNPLL